MKTLVYKVFEYESKRRKFPWFAVYNDGSVEALLFSEKLHTREGAKELNKAVSERMNTSIETMKDVSSDMVGSLCYGPFMPSDENWPAFTSLCILLESSPPFDKKYKIKYYGKGDPWIPNPDYDPLRIVN